MKSCIVIVAVAMLLGGCATFSSLPPEARQVVRKGLPSTRVFIERPKLRFSDGVYLVEGFVQRNLTRQSTIGSYLKVALFNAAGAKLSETRVDFTPAELPFRIGRSGISGSYSLVLGALPPGTARLEVRAYDVGPPAGR